MFATFALLTQTTLLATPAYCSSPPTGRIPSSFIAKDISTIDISLGGSTPILANVVESGRMLSSDGVVPLKTETGSWFLVDAASSSPNEEALIEVLDVDGNVPDTVAVTNTGSYVTLTGNMMSVADRILESSIDPDAPNAWGEVRAAGDDESVPEDCDAEYYGPGQFKPTGGEYFGGVLTCGTTKLPAQFWAFTTPGVATAGDLLDYEDSPSRTVNQCFTVNGHREVLCDVDDNDPNTSGPMYAVYDLLVPGDYDEFSASDISTHVDLKMVGLSRGHEINGNGLVVGTARKGTEWRHDAVLWQPGAGYSIHVPPADTKYLPGEVTINTSDAFVGTIRQDKLVNPAPRGLALGVPECSNTFQLMDDASQVPVTLESGGYVRLRTMRALNDEFEMVVLDQTNKVHYVSPVW